MLSLVREQILKCLNGNELVSVSHIPMDFGKNICVDYESSVLSMFRQILFGLESISSDVVFLCEHDVLYHPSHFEFTPERDDKYYFNTNVWSYCTKTKRALFYEDARKTSCMVAHRDLLINHYRLKIKKIERDGWTTKMGFEPGKTPPKGVDYFERARWKSEYPNVDIKHGGNITKIRFDKRQYRQELIGWTVSDEIPYWGKVSDLYEH